MKRVTWIRKLGLGSCVNAKERDNLGALTIGAGIGTEALKSRATIAEAVGGNATGAVALGALAIGGFAVGCLVIGRLMIRQLLIQRVHLRSLKIDQLEVENLRVRKLTVLEEQHPSSSGEPDIPPARASVVGVPEDGFPRLALGRDLCGLLLKHLFPPDRQRDHRRSQRSRSHESIAAMLFQRRVSEASRFAPLGLTLTPRRWNNA